MSFGQFLWLVVVPLVLAVAIFLFRNSGWWQLASVLFAALVHILLLTIVEILPMGGLTDHGNTWQGYALIELGPFVVLVALIAALRLSRPSRSSIHPAVVAALVPVVYWVSLLLLAVLALNLGLVAH